MSDVMLPAGTGIPQDMSYHELPAEGETLAFWGRFLDKTDTDSGEHLRWTELRLYRIIDTDPSHDQDCPDEESRGMFGRQMWLLYIVAHSLVYHRLDGGCNRGVRIRVADFPSVNEDWQDLEPCPECHPEDLSRVMSPDERFRLEITLYPYIPCQTPGKVISSLYREPRCDRCRHKPHQDRKCRDCLCEDYREAPRTLSAPGRQLIEQVRRIDPEIAAVSVRGKRL